MLAKAIFRLRTGLLNRLPVLMNASFLGALCLFASVCIVCTISAFTLPIETRGRALQIVFQKIRDVKQEHGTMQKNEALSSLLDKTDSDPV